MADLPITVRISTPLPVDVRDLSKLDKIAARAAYIHGVDRDTLNLSQDGNNLVITYEVTAR